MDVGVLVRSGAQRWVCGLKVEQKSRKVLVKNWGTMGEHYQESVEEHWGRYLHKDRLWLRLDL